MQRHEKHQKIPESQQWLREKLESSVEKELYRILAEGYEQFSEFLFTLKIKN
jgi:hypothetical protein